MYCARLSGQALHRGLSPGRRQGWALAYAEQAVSFRILGRAIGRGAPSNAALLIGERPLLARSGHEKTAV